MANAKDIKNRIKSIQNTRQITKAMELVASSKLRKARERAEGVRPYFMTLYDALTDIAATSTDFSSIYLQPREVKKTCYVLIAGDRGLAGGYNSNVFKMFAQEISGKDVTVVPVGKKAVEYCRKRNIDIVTESFALVERIDQSSCGDIRALTAQLFKDGVVDRVVIFYTMFVSILTQNAQTMQVLPISDFKKNEKSTGSGFVLYEPAGAELFDVIVPQYVSGLMYGAVAQSWASELAARRTAMDSASKNADEMVSTLSLEYNRARQAAITQEITEIVSGAGNN